MLPTYYTISGESQEKRSEGCGFKGAGLARGRLAHGWRMKALLE